MFTGRIRNVSIIFTFSYIIMYILFYTNPTAFNHFFVWDSDNFYIWKIFTYIYANNVNIFFFFFKVMILYWFTSTLENLWGSKDLLIFLIFGILLQGILAFLYGYINYSPDINGDGGLYACLLIAFGFSYPNEEIRLFFVLPIKVKILAIISLVFILVSIIIILFLSSNYMIPVISGITLPTTFLNLLLLIAEYSPLILFYNRIFDFNIITFIKKRIWQSKINNSKGYKLYPAIIKTFNIDKTTEEKQLCDPEDFEKDDKYCISCENYNKCLERYEKNN